MPNGPGTYGPGLLGLFPQQQQGGQFFAGAAEGLLKGDDNRALDVTQQIEELNKQRRAFDRVLEVATKMGEDVSPLLPMKKFFDQEQQKIMQAIGAKSLLPSSATQPAAPQIGQPTLPQL